MGPFRALHHAQPIVSLDAHGKNYFGIETLLNQDSAGEIYRQTNEQLQQPDFTARSFLRRMNVKMSCTTDDPVDSLQHHKELQDSDFEITVLPVFHPDNAYNFDDPEYYNEYINQLEKASHTSISTPNDLLGALDNRMTYFHEYGGRLSDHGLEQIFYTPASSQKLANAINEILTKDNHIDEEQNHALTYYLTLNLCRTYNEHEWVQQFHLGPHAV